MHRDRDRRDPHAEARTAHIASPASDLTLHHSTTDQTSGLRTAPLAQKQVEQLALLCIVAEPASGSRGSAHVILLHLVRDRRAHVKRRV
eukprot:5497817-Prymnesium_polylepis.1